MAREFVGAARIPLALIADDDTRRETASAARTLTRDGPRLLRAPEALATGADALCLVIDITQTDVPEARIPALLPPTGEDPHQEPQ